MSDDDIFDPRRLGGMIFWAALEVMYTYLRRLKAMGKTVDGDEMRSRLLDGFDQAWNRAAHLAPSNFNTHLPDRPSPSIDAIVDPFWLTRWQPPPEDHSPDTTVRVDINAVRKHP